MSAMMLTTFDCVAHAWRIKLYWKSFCEDHDARAFEAAPHTYTVINANSPTQLVLPMARSIIDFARADHFCATEHAMARNKTVGYAPLVGDATNFGIWSEAGWQTVTDRERGGCGNRFCAISTPPQCWPPVRNRSTRSPPAGLHKAMRPLHMTWATA